MPVYTGNLRIAVKYVGDKIYAIPREPVLTWGTARLFQHTQGNELDSTLLGEESEAASSSSFRPTIIAWRVPIHQLARLFAFMRMFLGDIDAEPDPLSFLAVRA